MGALAIYSLAQFGSFLQWKLSDMQKITQCYQKNELLAKKIKSSKKEYCGARNHGSLTMQVLTRGANNCQKCTNIYN